MGQLTLKGRLSGVNNKTSERSIAIARVVRPGMS